MKMRNAMYSNFKNFVFGVGVGVGVGVVLFWYYPWFAPEMLAMQ